MADNTEAEDVRDLAYKAIAPKEFDPAKLYGTAEPMALLDLEKFLPNPHRSKGNVVLHTADALVAWTMVYQSDATNLMADIFASKIKATINSDTATTPGWGDFTGELTLRHTPEWLHWASHDSRLTTQIEFAEHIEDGQDQIVDPAAADMLEIAQSFEAHNQVNFKQANRLVNGERQFTYEEQLDAKAGSKGSITVPDRFTLMLTPFEGADSYEIVARLRYKLRDGNLTIGYKLINPEDVLRKTFADVVKKIEAGTSLTAYRGQA